MKKLFAMLLAAAALTLCAACGGGEDTVSETPTPEPAPSETPAPETPEPEPTPEIDTSGLSRITLYIPNGSADGFDKREMWVTLDAQFIINVLMLYGAFPDCEEGIEVLSFEQDGASLSIDLSKEFRTALSAAGAAGETMYFGTLVNTLLGAFDAEEITVTCMGEAIVTGNGRYELPLTFIG